MIQRIQTIYLLIASVISGGLIFVFNLWKTLKNNVFTLDLFQHESVLLKFIPISFLVSAILSIVTIFFI